MTPEQEEQFRQQALAGFRNLVERQHEDHERQARWGIFIGDSSIPVNKTLFKTKKGALAAIAAKVPNWFYSHFCEIMEATGTDSGMYHSFSSRWRSFPALRAWAIDEAVSLGYIRVAPVVSPRAHP